MIIIVSLDYVKSLNTCHGEIVYTVNNYLNSELWPLSKWPNAFVCLFACFLFCFLLFLFFKCKISEALKCNGNQWVSLYKKMVRQGRHYLSNAYFHLIIGLRPELDSSIAGQTSQGLNRKLIHSDEGLTLETSA